MHIQRFTLLIFLTAMVCAITTTAQISLVPLEYNHIIAEAAKSEEGLLRKQVNLDTLPFVDDFALDGPFPSTERWVDNHVFVNSTMAVDPPSIGVATFDGLDNTGSPYGTNGSGDTLTSVGIDLDISAQNLFLSYYVQPKGFGEKPDANDSLILEFKDESGMWTMQKFYTGTNGPLPLADVNFMFDSIQINDLSFLHADFQFRFRNTSSGKGNEDLWHLDMVRLINNQIPSTTFEDLAFQYPSQGILKRYTAMPIRQFLSNTNSHLRSTFTFSIYNHFDDGLGIGSATSSLMEINELNSGQQVLAPSQYLTSAADLNIGPDTTKNITVEKEFDINQSFNGFDALQFETTFSVVAEEDQNDPGLLDNNFIRQRTLIDDYYAYDDGTAEIGIQAEGSGTNIAVQYRTTVADTLTAIQIHFTRARNDVSDQLFNLKVWRGSLQSDPVFVGELLKPLYVDELADTLQGFTTYRLQQTFTEELLPVPIDADTDFFIGWEQVSNEFDDAIPVGFDITIDGVSPYNFFSTDETNWTPFPSATLNGAVMIRPVMGVNNAIYTSVSKPQTEKINLYPNPTAGELNIKWNNKENLSAQVDVFDIQGKMVHSQDWQSDNIQLGFLPAGIYLIHLSDADSNVLLREKLIIQPK